MKLVDDAKIVFRHYSTQALFWAANLQGTWALMPEDLKSSFPGYMPKTIAWITFAILSFGLGGKFVRQDLGK